MSYKVYKTCVIDDEAQIRQELAKTLNDSDVFNVVSQAESVVEGIASIKKYRPEVLFLDIKLRGGDAFQLLNVLRQELDQMPAVILNTGYRDFDLAQKAFNEYKDCVLLILKKPFWHNWSFLEKEIIAKLNAHYQDNMESIEYSSEFITITRDYKTWRIFFDELIYIEVPSNTKGSGKINIRTSSDQFLLTGSLRNIASDLPEYFIQISRFYLINVKYFRSIDHSTGTLALKNIRDVDFKLGKPYKEELYKKLGM